jgi:hypothetical protein
MLMSVSAAGDLANNNTASLLPCSLGPAPLWQLVPCDNNLGLRAVIPVPGGGRRRGLLAAFRERRFWAANPLRDSAKMEIRAITPSFLSSRGWSMRFDNAGGSSFTLGSHDSREIRPRLVAGQSFSKADVMAAGTVSIVIVALANGLVVGGLTYILDPYLEWPPHLREEEERHQFAHNEREHERGEEHKEEGRDRRRKVKFEIDLDS